MSIQSTADARQSKAPAATFFWKLLRTAGALPVLLIALLIFFGLSSEHFLTARNLSTVLTQTVYLTIVVIAQTIVLITGGFDLSVGASVSLISIVTGLTLLNTGPEGGILLAVLAGAGIGVLVGAVNGAIVALFRVSPFIVTLAMLSIVSGMALIVSGGVPVFGLPSAFRSTFFTGRILGIPIPWIATLLVIAFAYLMLYWTRLGRYWYAIGGNESAARLAGVPLKAFLFLAYTIAGLFVGVAGVLLTARVGSGEPNLGANLPLESIAAAVIGGVSVRGGEGSLWGAILGAFFLVLLRNGMDLIGVSSYVQMLVTGGLLIFAIVVDRYIHRT
jgi:ribose/xylose/arabinose/galactoside ABC-type transport system permease subunit